MKIIEKQNYPKQLQEIENPPEKLYVLGNERLLYNPSLSIVGSRNCTEYGIKYARQFAKEIAESGITIISGLALGIDTVAHETAQKCKGRTVAVVGCGLNHIYPEENKELFKTILKNDGCIISEYEPNEPVDMKNFPKRNRIISGLSNGVLVVEASYRSGSKITGRLGLKQGKKVYCFPRDIGTEKGVGTNELIQKGAKLVISPQDILQDYGIKVKQPALEIESELEQKIEKQSIQNKANSNSTNVECYIPKEYMNIYQFISYEPQNINYFAKRSGLKIAEVTQKLIMLELQGYIKSMPRKLLCKNVKERSSYNVHMCSLCEENICTRDI